MRTARRAGCTWRNIWLHRCIQLFPRRVTSDTLMWTTSGEGAGSCWAHSFKGSRSVEGTPGYAASVKAVGTRGRLRKDARAFEAAGSKPGTTIDMV